MFQPGSQKEKAWRGTLSGATPCPQDKKPLGTVYRPRNHETPFFKIVRDHFDDFEKVYPERYQAKYGYWRRFEVPAGGRPVIRSSIYKFLKPALSMSKGAET